MKLSNLFKPFLVTTALTIGLAGCGAANQDDSKGGEEASKPKNQVVNIYTARHYEVDDEIYTKFTEETGIKVNVVKGEAEELIERIKREGESTAADLFVTVDGGVLANAKQNDILQPVISDVINENVPENLRDVDNNWIGLATRARIIAYSKDRVQPKELSTYEDLTNDKWKGKLLVRSSTSLYNQSLLASFIELNGEEKAQQWSQGIVNNFARQPDGGGREAVRPEDLDADPAHGQVEPDHSGDPEHQGTREVAPRLPDLLGDEVCGLPAAVGEEHRHHGGRQSAEEGPRGRAGGSGLR